MLTACAFPTMYPFSARHETQKMEFEYECEASGSSDLRGFAAEKLSGVQRFVL